MTPPRTRRAPVSVADNKAVHSAAWMIEVRLDPGQEYYGPFTLARDLGEWLDHHAAAFPVSTGYVIHPLGVPGSVNGGATP